MHTVVSFDFAVGIVPGWHATIFPPYFVAGAIYAGFAMVLTLAIPLRKFYGLEDFITMKHLENMAKVMLATGLIVAYGYMMEAFMAWYSGNHYERFMIMEPDVRPLLVGLLGAHPLQRGGAQHSSGSRTSAPACPFLFVHLAGGERRDVARALRHHRDQPPPRLPALVVGHVRGDACSTGRPSSAPSASS